MRLNTSANSHAQASDETRDLTCDSPQGSWRMGQTEAANLFYGLFQTRYHRAAMRSVLSRLSFFVVAFLVASQQRLLAQRPVHDRYSFACASAHYMLEDFDKQPSVPSPDGSTAVQLTKGDKFRVVANDTVLGNLNFPDVSSNIEVGWSPDSSQLFISYSDGGEIGGYHVHLFRVTGGKLQESQIPSVVAARFKAKHWCESRGNNLFFLDWTADSKVGFFVAEVYPTSDCGREMAQFRGYAVNLRDGTILRVFTEKETDAIEKRCRKSGRLALPSDDLRK